MKTQQTDCTHNAMVANDDPSHAWKCADCGHVYGTAAPAQASVKDKAESAKKLTAWLAEQPGIKQTSHSPLPWKSGPAGDELSSALNVPKGTMLIAAKRSNGSWDHVASLAQSAEPEANAAFIVRACNEYEKLKVDAIEDVTALAELYKANKDLQAHAQRLADELQNVLKYGSAGNENLIREALAQYNEGK